MSQCCISDPLEVTASGVSANAKFSRVFISGAACGPHAHTKRLTVGRLVSAVAVKKIWFGCVTEPTERSVERDPPTDCVHCHTEETVAEALGGELKSSCRSHGPRVHADCFGEIIYKRQETKIVIKW